MSDGFKAKELIVGDLVLLGDTDGGLRCKFPILFWSIHPSFVFGLAWLGSARIPFLQPRISLITPVKDLQDSYPLHDLITIPAYHRFHRHPCCFKANYFLSSILLEVHTTARH